MPIGRSLCECLLDDRAELRRTIAREPRRRPALGSIRRFARNHEVEERADTEHVCHWCADLARKLFGSHEAWRALACSEQRVTAIRFRTAENRERIVRACLDGQ